MSVKESMFFAHSKDVHEEITGKLRFFNGVLQQQVIVVTVGMTEKGESYGSRDGEWRDVPSVTEDHG